MVKPAPTGTKSKIPVSLPPVRALSSASAEPQAETPPSTKAEARPVASAAVPPQATAAGQAVAKPASPTAAAPSITQKPLATEKPASPAAPTPVRADAVAPAKADSSRIAPASAPAVKAAPAKHRIEKPVAKVVAPKIPAKAPAAAPKAEGAKAPVSAKVAPQEIAPRGNAAPVELKQAPEPTRPAEVAAPAPVVKPAEPVPTPVAAKLIQPVSLDSLPLPRPPEAATVASATMMSQALTMARAFGALQARMLDHACAELEATLHDAQTLARSNSASEAITLQAKAVRRSYESYAEHLKELARVANAALRKD